MNSNKVSNSSIFHRSIVEQGCMVALVSLIFGLSYYFSGAKVPTDLNLWTSTNWSAYDWLRAYSLAGGLLISCYYLFVSKRSKASKMVAIALTALISSSTCSVAEAGVQSVHSAIEQALKQAATLGCGLNVVSQNTYK